MFVVCAVFFYLHRTKLQLFLIVMNELKQNTETCCAKSPPPPFLTPYPSNIEFQNSRQVTIPKKKRKGKPCTCRIWKKISYVCLK